MFARSGICCQGYFFVEVPSKAPLPFKSSSSLTIDQMVENGVVGCESRTLEIAFALSPRMISLLIFYTCCVAS